MKNLVQKHVILQHRLRNMNLKYYFTKLNYKFIFLGRYSQKNRLNFNFRHSSLQAIHSTVDMITGIKH